MATSMIEHARFADRAAAGRALAATLAERGHARAVVLALARGGVVVAGEIASVLDAPLDVLLVRKLGLPGHEELALGAVTDGPAPARFVDEGLRRAAGVSTARLERIEARALAEIERRRRRYVGECPPVALEGRTAVLVDDGIATGATMRVALDAVRRRRPAALVVATAVAPPEIVGRLAAEVDDVVCLLEPEPFHAVGLHYEDFDPVSDAEVVDTLACARGRTGEGA